MQLNEKRLNRYIDESIDEFLIEEGFLDNLKGALGWGQKPQGPPPVPQQDQQQKKGGGFGNIVKGVWNRATKKVPAWINRNIMAPYMLAKSGLGSEEANQWLRNNSKNGNQPRWGKDSVGSYAMEFNLICRWLNYHHDELQRMINIERGGDGENPESVTRRDYEFDKETGKIRQTSYLPPSDYIIRNCTYRNYTKWANQNINPDGHNSELRQALFAYIIEKILKSANPQQAMAYLDPRQFNKYRTSYECKKAVDRQNKEWNNVENPEQDNGKPKYVKPETSSNQQPQQPQWQGQYQGGQQIKGASPQQQQGGQQPQANAQQPQGNNWRERIKQLKAQAAARPQEESKKYRKSLVR